MGVFESLSSTSDKATSIAEMYYKRSLEYYKLKVFQQISLATGSFFKAAIIGSLLFLGIILLAFSAAVALAALWNNLALATLAVAFVFFLFAFIIYRYRARIDRLVIKKLSKDFFD